MSGRGMEVDPAHLHAGADRCVDAADTALAGAGRLEGTTPAAGIFGDFAAAHDFHEALSAAHSAHVDLLQGHHRALTDVGDKSRSAANDFIAQDALSADSLRAAEAGF